MLGFLSAAAGAPALMQYRSGAWYAPLSSTRNTVQVPQGYLIFTPRLVLAHHAFDQARVNVTIAGAGSVMRLGLYDSVDGIPVNRISQTTDLSTAAVTRAAGAFDGAPDLEPGLYFDCQAGNHVAGAMPTVSAVTNNDTIFPALLGTPDTGGEYGGGITAWQVAFGWTPGMSLPAVAPVQPALGLRVGASGINSLRAV